MIASRWFLVVLFAAALCACRSKTPAFPPGAGLASVDREAPPGAELFARPTFQDGDWFGYRRGGLLRLRYRVTTDPKGDGYLLIDEDADRVLVLDRDLAQLGEGAGPKSDGLIDWSVRLDPLDPSFAWPLWVGKRWSGSYVHRRIGGDEMPFTTFYEVKGRETVHTAAGAFETLRIERRASPALEGDYIDRVSLLWYAPEVGFLVSRLEDGVKTELEEYHRQ